MNTSIWPRWRVDVAVELQNGQRWGRAWEVNAATVAAALRDGPNLAAGQMSREKVKGRSKIRSMTVLATAVERISVMEQGE